MVDTEAPFFGQNMELGKHEQKVVWSRIQGHLHHFVECTVKNEWPEPSSEGIRIIESYE